MTHDDTPEHALARFAAELTIDRIPEPVLRRAEDLLLDWIGSALAGKGARPVETITRFARAMGGGAGPCEILIDRTRSTPLMAAMANAAASHFAEQDDVHNGSVFHPAAVVFPVALAIAQADGLSGAELLTAAVAGYEVGIRVGEFLGRSHYKIFHTTGTAGAVAAAVTAGRLLRLDAEQMQHAIARPAPRLRACGSSCATPPIPSSCTRHTQPAPASPRHGWRAMASPARGAS